jgi:hypothetical protein
VQDAMDGKILKWKMNAENYNFANIIFILHNRNSKIVEEMVGLMIGG